MHNTRKAGRGQASVVQDSSQHLQAAGVRGRGRGVRGRGLATVRAIPAGRGHTPPVTPFSSSRPIANRDVNSPVLSGRGRGLPLPTIPAHEEDRGSGRVAGRRRAESSSEFSEESESVDGEGQIRKRRRTMVPMVYKDGTEAVAARTRTQQLIRRREPIALDTSSIPVLSFDDDGREPVSDDSFFLRGRVQKLHNEGSRLISAASEVHANRSDDGEDSEDSTAARTQPLQLLRRSAARTEPSVVRATSIQKTEMHRLLTKELGLSDIPLPGQLALDSKEVESLLRKCEPCLNSASWFPWLQRYLNNDKAILSLIQLFIQVIGLADWTHENKLLVITIITKIDATLQDDALQVLIRLIDSIAMAREVKARQIHGHNVISLRNRRLLIAKLNEYLSGGEKI